jgi:hypothetical protein
MFEQKGRARIGRSGGKHEGRDETENDKMSET